MNDEEFPEPELFDDTFTLFVITELLENKDCLKERELKWCFIFGLIMVHLKWFKDLKNKCVDSNEKK